MLSTWHQLFMAHPQITLRAPVDQAGLFHKLFEYAEELENGRWRSDQATSRSDLLRELTAAMGQASICGLGKVAPNPLMTLLKQFPGEFESRLQR